MSYLKICTISLVALALHGTAWAQIYETKDAEGNVEFTDSPPTEGAEVVDLPETNVADAPPPQEQAQPATEVVEQAPVQVNNTVNIQEDNDGYENDGYGDVGYGDAGYDDDLARQRRLERESLPDPGRVDPGYERPHEVGDSDDQMPHEVGDSDDQMPHEVGDSPVTGAHRQ